MLPVDRSYSAWGREPFPGDVNWIAPPGGEARQGWAFRARRRVSREALDPLGRIWVAAESYYALYVNGERAALGPARGTMTCSFADCVDVSEHLISGVNDLSIEIYCDNIPNCHSAPAEPAVFLSSGSISSDEAWEVQWADDYRHDVQLYTFQVGLTEWRDLRLVPLGWQCFADTSTWFPARVIPTDRPIYRKSLFVRDVAALRQRIRAPKQVVETYGLSPLVDPNDVRVAALMTEEPLTPYEFNASALCRGEALDVVVPPDAGGVCLILDFGQTFIGHLCLHVESSTDALIDVGYQEELEGGRLRLEFGDYHFADRYAVGPGRSVVDTGLRWRGGRYLQLAIRGASVRIHRVAMIDDRYPVDAPARVVTEDADINELWRRCVETVRSCATDTVMDCPWREMALWVNDLLVINRFWLQLTGRPDLVRRSIALALSQRDPSGLIPGVCPYDGRASLVLFATNLFMPMMLRDYLMYTGDAAFVREACGEAAHLIEQCERHRDQHGLLRPAADLWNFVDWSYELNELSLNGKTACVVNWCHVHALKAMADLCTTLGCDGADEWSSRAAGAAETIDRHFWDEARQCYRELRGDEGEREWPLGSQLTHALALLSGFVAEDRRDAVESALQRDDLLVPELYMLHFVLEALAETGRLDATDELIRRYWGSMLGTDTSTIWEANVHQHGKQAYENRGSLCHAFSLAPVNVLQRHIVGVCPIEPGFRRFALRPMTSMFRSVAATVPTPHGDITVAWSAEDQLTVGVPDGTTAVMADGRELPPGQHIINFSDATLAAGRSERDA